MIKATIDVNKCPQNHPCPAIKTCPVDALSQVGFNAPTINEDLCIGCGNCSSFCPKGALSLKEV